MPNRYPIGNYTGKDVQPLQLKTERYLPFQGKSKSSWDITPQCFASKSVLVQGDTSWYMVCHWVAWIKDEYKKNIHKICVVKKMMIRQQYFHWNVFCKWYFERLKGKWCNIEQLEKVIMHQYTFCGLTKDGQKLCSLSKKKMTLLLEKVLWMHYNIITTTFVA